MSDYDMGDIFEETDAEQIQKQTFSKPTEYGRETII